MLLGPILNNKNSLFVSHDCCGSSCLDKSRFFLLLCDNDTTSNMPTQQAVSRTLLIFQNIQWPSSGRWLSNNTAKESIEIACVCEALNANTSHAFSSLYYLGCYWFEHRRALPGRRQPPHKFQLETLWIHCKSIAYILNLLTAYEELVCFR